MGIFVAVPVFDGVDFVAETLESIQAQTYKDFAVLISVDGNDQRSAQECKPFLSDARFRMSVQPHRLGWAANLNWLMGQCSEDFYCYWQQDDTCEPSYLAVLKKTLTQHPEAVCAFSDLRWFGTRADLVSTPSSTGRALDRVLDQIEHGHYVPFRGLIRRQSLHAAGPIRLTPNNSALQDQVWLAKLVGLGPWQRAEGTLYFKRGHENETHRKWEASEHDAARRNTWLEWGLGMLEAALRVATAEEREAIVNLLVRRLTQATQSRWLFYDPGINGSDELKIFCDEFRQKARGLTSPSVPR